MRRRNIVLGAFLLTLGVLLLLFNFGLVQINIFRLFQFWPLVLIALGLAILLGRRFSRIVVLLVVVGVVILIALTIEFGGTFWDTGSVAASDILGPDIEQVEYALDAAGLQLDVSAKELDRDAVVIEFAGYKPELKHHKRGDTLVVEIDQPKRLAKMRRNEWNVQLSNVKPLALKLNIAACDADLDLEDVILTGLEVSCGAGNLELKLPPRGGRSVVKVNVAVAAGSIELALPDTAAVMIQYDKAIGTHNLTEQGFIKDAMGLYSQLWGKSEASVTYEIHVGSAISDLEIDWYKTR